MSYSSGTYLLRGSSSPVTASVHSYSNVTFNCEETSYIYTYSPVYNISSNIGSTVVVNDFINGDPALNFDTEGGAITLVNENTFPVTCSATIDDGGSFKGDYFTLCALDFGGSITFGSGGGTLILTTSTEADFVLNSVTVDGFGTGFDIIDLKTFNASEFQNYIISGSDGNYTIKINMNNGPFTITDNNDSGPALTDGTYTSLTGGPLYIADDGDGGLAVVACFLEGTRIRTPDGDVTVESLKPADLVVTLNNRAVPLKAVLRRSLTPAAFPNTQEILPVRVCAGALAEGVPQRDLFISPDHSLYLNNALVPAKLLLNDETITQTTRMTRVNYYHIELEPHEIIFAEGAATESYLDIGCKQYFGNSAVVSELHKAIPKTWEDACAPLVLTGPKLAAIRADLAARAVVMRDDQPLFSKVA